VTDENYPLDKIPGWVKGLSSLSLPLPHLSAAHFLLLQIPLPSTEMMVVVSVTVEQENLGVDDTPKETSSAVGLTLKLKKAQLESPLLLFLASYHFFHSVLYPERRIFRCGLQGCGWHEIPCHNWVQESSGKDQSQLCWSLHVQLRSSYVFAPILERFAVS